MPGRIGAALLALSMGIAGCAGMDLSSVAQQPQVSVQDVQLKALGLTGGSVDIRLSVHNPNHFSLEGVQLTYRLWVDSVSFGSGTTSDRFLVNAGDSTVVTLPLDFTWAGIENAGRTMMETGTLPYRVTGNVRVSSILGAITVPYDRTGKLSPLSGAGG